LHPTTVATGLITGELMMVLLAGKLGPVLEAITRNCLGCGDILNTDLA